MRVGVITFVAVPNCRTRIVVAIGSFIGIVLQSTHAGLIHHFTSIQLPILRQKFEHTV